MTFRDNGLSLTASCRHLRKDSNSDLQISFLTSVYVATMHLPYADAWTAQVVVVAEAKRRSGVSASLLAFCADIGECNCGECWIGSDEDVGKKKQNGT